GPARTRVYGLPRGSCAPPLTSRKILPRRGAPLATAGLFLGDSVVDKHGGHPQRRKTADGCLSGMDSAQLYRARAGRLRELASTERDVSVRQQLHYSAIRFDQFADELDEWASHETKGIPV